MKIFKKSFLSRFRKATLTFASLLTLVGTQAQGKELTYTGDSIATKTIVTAVIDGEKKGYSSFFLALKVTKDELDKIRDLGNFEITSEDQVFFDYDKAYNFAKENFGLQNFVIISHDLSTGKNYVMRKELNFQEEIRPTLKIEGVRETLLSDK